MTLKGPLRLALASGLIVALLNGSAWGQRRGTIFYLSRSLLNEFQTVSQNAMVAVYGSLGYEMISLDARNEPGQQLIQLEDAIEQSPEAIIMNAVDPESIVAGVERARAAGIKVLSYDRQIRTTELDLTSVAATVEMGRIAAAEAIRLLTERNGEARGKILQIVGHPDDDYTLEIQKGFEERLGTDAPNVQLITEPTGWDPAEALNITSAQLSANKDIDLIFCHASFLTEPIIRALQETGSQPGDILVMALGGDPKGLDNIRSGWQQVAIEYPLYAQIYGLAMFTPRTLAGARLEPGTYDVFGLMVELTVESWGPNLSIPGAVITNENVDDARFWGNLTPPDEPVPVVDPGMPAQPTESAEPAAPPAEVTQPAQPPPEPLSRAAESVEGVDFDRDGMRDDIQTYIASAYPDSERLRAGLAQYARAFQKSLVEASSTEASVRNAEERHRAIECFYFMQPQRAPDIHAELQARILDTRERALAYLEASSHLSGQTFSLSRDPGSQCAFNPDQLRD